MNPTQIRSILHLHFEVVESKCRGDEIAIICPDCQDQSGHRSVNLQSGLTNCFLCQQGGMVRNFFQRHGLEVVGDTASMGLTPSPYDLAVQRQQTPRLRAADRLLPEDFTEFREDRSTVPGKRHTVWYQKAAELAERKNLRIEDFIEVGAGYSRADPVWEPFCIFPARMRHVLSRHRPEWTVSMSRYVAYFQGRTYDDEAGRPTKRFPSKQVAPRGMAHHLYWHPGMFTGSTLVVVESVLNVLSLVRKFREVGLQDVVPVSTFHAGVSKEQWRTMLEDRNIKEVCLLFDHDATDKARAIAAEAAWRHGVGRTFTVAGMPDTCGPKTDPNDDVDAALAALKVRRQVLHQQPTSARHRA